MNKDIQSAAQKSVLCEGADKTLRLNLKIPNPDTATPVDVVRYRVQVGQAWIEEDIRRGVLPQSLASFSEAGDYMDHNMYVIDEDLVDSKIGNFYLWDWDVEIVCQHLNAVAYALDGWLRDGRKRNALEFLDISEIAP